MQIDPYRDIADLYDCEHRDFRDDIAFYLATLPSETILEVGVGTGRIAEALAQRGLEVWGVDPSAAMLDRARRRLATFQRVHLVEGGVEDVPPDLLVGTALLSLNTLWHFRDSAAQLLLLQRLRTHLPPEGTLIVDLSNPLTLADRGARGELRERFRGPCLAGSMRVTSAAWDDEVEQLLTLSLTYDLTAPDGQLRRTETSLELRYLYRFEAELLLRLGGFFVQDILGGYDGEPYNAQSPNLLFVAAPSVSD